MEKEKHVQTFHKANFYYNEDFLPEMANFKKFIAIDKKLRENLKNTSQLFSVGIRNAIRLYNKVMKAQIEREANANTTN